MKSKSFISGGATLLAQSDSIVLGFLKFGLMTLSNDS